MKKKKATEEATGEATMGFMANRDILLMDVENRILEAWANQVQPAEEYRPHEPHDHEFAG